MDHSAQINKLHRQQTALAEFGVVAFRSSNFQVLIDRAAAICADLLGARYCTINRFRFDSNDLLIVAGFGLEPDVVGKAVSKADRTSPVGKVYITGEPVIYTNLAECDGFVLPEFYVRHGIVATVNVIIHGSNGDGVYGVLEVASPVPRAFDTNDIHFLTTFANILAEAVATVQRLERLRVALEEKEVLASELQHRVRNNLHLIAGMLAMEAQDASEMEQRFRTIASRVQALATVYDHLLGTGLARDMEFNKYLVKLCENLRHFQAVGVRLISDHLEPVTVDLDTATAIGLAVTELITNSYKHAFPKGEGTIEITLDHRGQVPVVIVQDDGIGIPTTVTGNRQGLGLVRRLVEQVDASIQICQSGKGAHYEIALPPQANAA